jgi:hypothetical protein
LSRGVPFSPMSPVLYITTSLVCAVTGGAIGALLVSLPTMQLTFDLGNVVGPLLAAAFAAWVAHRLGILDHLRSRSFEARRTRQADAVKRLVDDGTESVAEALARDGERALNNCVTVTTIIDWLGEGRDIPETGRQGSASCNPFGPRSMTSTTQ